MWKQTEEWKKQIEGQAEGREKKRARNKGVQK